MVVVSAVLGAGSRVYAKPFLDVAVFGDLLKEAETRAGIKLGPITLAGWSAGCGAIRQIMSTPEYYDKVANTIMIDGIHTSYVDGKPGPLESQIDPQPLQIFIKLARDAMAGKKRVIHHAFGNLPGNLCQHYGNVRLHFERLRITLPADPEMGTDGDTRTKRSACRQVLHGWLCGKLSS
jgi:hypothetical protein